MTATTTTSSKEKVQVRLPKDLLDTIGRGQMTKTEHVVRAARATVNEPFLISQAITKRLSSPQRAFDTTPTTFWVDKGLVRGMKELAERSGLSENLVYALALEATLRPVPSSEGSGQP